MCGQETNEETNEKLLDKKEVEEYLNVILEKLNSSDDAYMHSVLAFNHILRQPNAAEVFDDNMLRNAKEIWVKIRSMGIMLGDPPLIYGLPEDNKESH